MGPWDEGSESYQATRLELGWGVLYKGKVFRVEVFRVEVIGPGFRIALEGMAFRVSVIQLRVQG